MMGLASLMLLFLSVLGFVQAAPTQNYGSCTTASTKQGICVHIQDCPYLYDIFNAKVTSEADRKLLTDSQCGFTGTSNGGLVKGVLVCCPQSGAGNELPKVGVCGTLFADRIIGGRSTKLYEFPWMALLQYKKPTGKPSFNCGGALINSRYVLTAGHCLNSTRLPTNWLLESVRLGEWDTSKAPDCVDEANGKRTCAPMHIDIEIEKRIIHENYQPASINQLNDIALLRLKESVTFTEYVKPICLPLAQDVRQSNFEGYAMDVAGWGLTEDDVPSNIKLKITVDVWNLQRCQVKYRAYSNQLDSSQLCAGGKEKEDTCSGDSGGPLMVSKHVDGAEIFYAAGVTSYGPNPCGLPGWPGVYTRTGAFIDWIQAKLEA